MVESFIGIPPTTLHENVDSIPTARRTVKTIETVQDGQTLEQLMEIEPDTSDTTYVQESNDEVAPDPIDEYQVVFDELVVILREDAEQYYNTNKENFLRYALDSAPQNIKLYYPQCHVGEIAAMIHEDFD